jgi:hypothetical protein
MEAFLFVLGLMSVLIAFGVCVSLYLYKGGAVGKRRRLVARSFQTLATETAAENYGEDEFYEGLGPTISTTSSLARKSLLVLLAGFAVIVMLLTSFVNTLPH